MQVSAGKCRTVAGLALLSLAFQTDPRGVMMQEWGQVTLVWWQ